MIDLTAIRPNLSSQNIQRMVPYYVCLYNFQQLYELILEYYLYKSRLRPNNTLFEFIGLHIRKSIRT